MKRGPKPGTRKGIPSPHRGKGGNYQWIKDHVGHADDKCLIWPFSYRWNGYGQVGLNGKVRYPHRIMCELAHGEPPSRKHVAAHSCHNGRGGCVNPRHLSWKTASENILERTRVPQRGKRWHHQKDQPCARKHCQDHRTPRQEEPT